MDRPPDIPTPTIEVERRAGVNGVTIWNTGTRPPAFVLVTMRDTVNQADAITAFSNYATLVGAAPQTLVYQGLTWAYKVAVLAVEPVELRATILGVGGVLGNSRGLARVRWTLQPWVTA